MEKAKRILKLLPPYLFCAVLPILLVLLLGRMLLNNYSEKIISDKMEQVESAFEEYQSKLTELESIIYYINDMDEVLEYVYNVLGNRENTLSNDREIMNFLHVFQMNEEIEEIYLYDSRGERIIATGATLNNAARYFQYYYQIEGCDPEESVERLRNMPSQLTLYPVFNVNKSGADVKVMELSMQIPLKTRKHYTLQLVVAVKAEVLFEDLQKVCGEGGEFYVYDGADQLLFGSGSRYESLVGLSEARDITELSKGEEQLYAAVLCAADDSCKIKVYIPQYSGMNESERESGYIVYLMIICVVVSLGICIYYTVKNYKEIQGIMDLFKYRSESEPESYDYRGIRINMDRLVNENKIYLERMNMLKKDRFMNQLIHNEPGQRSRDDLTFDIKDGSCAVFCIRYEGSDYRRTVDGEMTFKDLVKLYLLDMFKEEAEVFDPSARETVCMIYCTEQERMSEIMRNMVVRLNSDIFLVNGIRAVWGTGSLVESVYQIGESYNQAKAVIAYNKMSGRSLLLYTEMQSFTEEYYYPREFNEMLYNCVAAGRTESAMELIKQLREENLEKNTKMLTAKALKLLKERLTDAVVSIGDKCGISVDGMAARLEHEENMESFFEQVNNVICVICADMEYRRCDINKNVSVRVVEYINENYMNNSMDMDMISQEFGLQKDYLSRLFKAEYGEKLSVVIEKVRIERACELLKQSKFNIAEISKMVGYNSDISFRRAFKKVMGITPIEYKNVHESIGAK